MKITDIPVFRLFKRRSKLDPTEQLLEPATIRTLVGIEDGKPVFQETSIKRTTGMYQNEDGTVFRPDRQKARP